MSADDTLEHVTPGGTTPSQQHDEAFLESLYNDRSFVRDETRIVLIGKTGSGKSATGNTLAGRRAFDSRPSGTSITRQCQQEMVRRFERHLQIVDTPGLFDTGMTNDTACKEIMKCMALTSPGLHAIVLVTKVNRFTEEEQRTVDYFRKVFGDRVLNYLVVVFTGKDELDHHGMTIENFVQESPAPLKQLIAECRGRFCAVNNYASEDSKVQFAKGFLQEVDKLVRSNGGRCYTTEMYRQAEALMKKREEELKMKLEEEKREEREKIEQSIKVKYDEVARGQEEQMSMLHTQLESMQKAGQEEHVHHQQAVDELQERLQQAEAERRRVDEDRREWEEKRRQEMEKQEKDRNEAMLVMMDRMEEERKRREEEMNTRMERIEAERREREAKMRRREDERQRREDEQREQMLKLEQEKQMALQQMREEMRQESERQSRRIEEMARNMARVETQDERGIFGKLIGGIRKVGKFLGLL